MMRYKDTRTGSCKGLIGNLDSRYCQSSRFLPHDAMGLHHQLTLQFNLHAPLHRVPGNSALKINLEFMYAFMFQIEFKP
jgi:hypothetical protein